MNMRLVLAATGLAGLAAACAPQAAVEGPPAAPAAPAAPAVAAEPALPAGPSAAPPARNLPMPPVDLVELERLTREGVAALLGDPDLYREEGAAQVLLYSQSACALHLFLYPPTLGATPVVEHLETIPAAPKTDTDRACLAALLARRPN